MDLRVLMVDDESTSLKLLEVLLSKSLQQREHSVHIDIARYPEKALNQIEELARTGKRYDFITCDYGMPGMLGDEFQREVRKTQSIPFIFVSGGAVGPGKIFLEKEPDSYAIAKPVDSEELNNAVDQILSTLYQ